MKNDKWLARMRKNPPSRPVTEKQLKEAEMQMPADLKHSCSAAEVAQWSCIVACLNAGVDPPTDAELCALWPLVTQKSVAA